MLNRVSAEPITASFITDQELMEFCACLDPNQLPLIRGLSVAAINVVEEIIGDFIQQRSIRWVFARGEQDKTDQYFRAWLSTRSYISFGSNIISGEWIQFPTAAQSVQSVTVGVWGADDKILTSTDYAVDLTTSPARMSFSYYPLIQDYYINFDHLCVDYTGGIAAAGSEPETIKLAVKIITKKLYENRDTEKSTLFDNAVDLLLSSYKRYSFGGARP